MFESDFDYRANALIEAATQGGKSKLTELQNRDHIEAESQIVNADAKGTTFAGLANYIARVPPKRKCLFFDPSSPYTIPIRFFHPRQSEDIGAHASRVTTILLNALGTEKVQDVYRFRRMCNMIVTYCAMTGAPITQAVNLLYFHNRPLCRSAADQCPMYRNEWLTLAGANSLSFWEQRTESTRNRLSPFLEIEPLRRMFGVPGGKDLLQELEAGTSLFFNISPLQSDEITRIIGGFLTSLLSQFAFARALRPTRLFIYLDEPQLYASPDLPKLLETGVGAGLRTTLICHHLNQFDDERLRATIRKNCRLKFIGAGTQADEAESLVRQHDFSDVNKRWHKEDKIAFVTEYDEEEVTDFTESETQSSSSGGFSRNDEVSGENESSASGSTFSFRHYTRLRPRQVEKVIGQEDWSYTEKIAMLSAKYLSLDHREFMVIRPGFNFKYTVPEIAYYWGNHLTHRLKIVEFMRKDSIPNEEIDRQLKALEESYGTVTRTSKIKKPPKART